MATDSAPDTIEIELDYELKDARLTSRQLLVQNEVSIVNLRKQINQIKQNKLNKKKEAEILNLYKEIQLLKSKNKLLIKNINKTQYEASKKEKESKSNNPKKRSRGVLNLRRFDNVFRFYMKQQIWKDILFIFIGSLLITIAFDYFVNSTGHTGIFPPGLGAVARKLSLVSVSQENSQNTFYFLFYIGLNIPFVIFGFFKVGFKFSVLTLLGLVFQNVINFIITISPIINPGSLKLLIDFQHLTETSEVGTTPVYFVWLFAFATIGAGLAGTGYSFLYRVGGSSAGTDFLSGYFQKKYHISIASVNILINIGIVLVIFIINTATISVNDLANFFHKSPAYINQRLVTAKIEFFFGPALFASFVLLTVQGVVSNYLYPRYKFLQVKVYTNKGHHLIQALNFKGFDNKITLINLDIFSKNQKFTTHEVTLYCSMVDLKKIKAIVKVLDPEAQYAASYVKSINYSLVNLS